MDTALVADPGRFVFCGGDVRHTRAFRLEVEHMEGLRVARVPHLALTHLEAIVRAG